MPISDSIASGLTVAGALGLAKQAQDFIAAVTGHPGESMGTILGNVAKRRVDNAEKVVGKAGLILLQIGLKVGEVPLNILQPALEAASLQEDAFLQDRWANLLANAADPRKISAVHESFPAILRELGVREVKYLDELIRTVGRDPARERIFTQHQLLRMYCALGLSNYPTLHSVTHGCYAKDGVLINAEMDKWEVCLGVLIGHGLMQLSQRQRPIRVDPGDILGPSSDRTLTFQIEGDTMFALTGLALEFVKACQVPTKEPAEHT